MLAARTRMRNLRPAGGVRAAKSLNLACQANQVATSSTPTNNKSLNKRNSFGRHIRDELFKHRIVLRDGTAMCGVVFKVPTNVQTALYVLPKTQTVINKRPDVPN